VRPTRTQQLKKPLKLYEPEIPEELLDKKGLADKILKRKEKERLSNKSKKRARYRNMRIINVDVC
jgi:ABC-type ATPase with predicted acetyltransferase domain